MKKIIFFLFFLTNLLYPSKYSSETEEISNFSFRSIPILMNDNIHFDQNNYFIAGLMNLDINFPQKYNLGIVNQKGVIIGSRKNSSNIDELLLGNNLGLHFNLGNENTFGFFTSNNYFRFPDNTVDTVQQYSGIANFFSYNINSEILIRLPIVDRKIIGGASITFFNIGVTATYLKGGRFSGKFFGAVDVIPFYFQLYGKFSLKNATFGFGTFINPYNFAEYRFGPRDLIGDEFGLKFNTAQFKKVGFIFYIYFN